MAVGECNATIMLNPKENFVTVVAVGNEKPPPQKTENSGDSDYVTVLTIGNEKHRAKPVCKDIIEEVIVYRLPGERLGFGLKFEGGTKANEFVKRLFIQSCAPESPASRVLSSWGQLIEGDEVLEIDGMPVVTMTRIDCVRFLKDSNVAIKLMVKHNAEKQMKPSGDLPVVISTEEKKPPPVPPRKIHRKLLKTQNKEADIQENIVPTIKQNNNESFFSKSSRLQSPRNSGRRTYYSPDVARRDRRLSDGSLGPPEAEIYVDLFSQESTLSLSESDDTGSTISTVLDRLGSFPATTTSSFAGSLPSTPTASQKHLDLSYVVNEMDDDDLKPNRTVLKPGLFEENNNIVNSIDEDDSLHFQDVPLNADNDIINTRDSFDNVELQTIKIDSIDPPKRPVVIPRTKPSPPPVQGNHLTLPRLVDFVPKSVKKDTDICIIKEFLENERFDFDCRENLQEDVFGSTVDVYGAKWTISSHLTTIGEEKEDEGCQEFQCNSRSNDHTPIVIVETIANNSAFVKQHEGNDINVPSKFPSSISKQFFDDVKNTDAVKKHNVLESNSRLTEKLENDEIDKKILLPIEPPNVVHISEPTILDKLISNTNLFYKTSDSPDNYIYAKLYKSDEDIELNKSSEKFSLHKRSQSLIDMSSFSREKKTKWDSIVESRRKGSRLKGLVIPEQNESDITPGDIVLPEIKSYTPLTMPLSNLDTNLKTYMSVQKDNIMKPSEGLPVLPSNNMVPKYSPAFKRKSLQVYPVEKNNNNCSFNDYLVKYNFKPIKQNDDETYPPKSLESIASPTRCDCTFNYVITNGNYERDFEKMEENCVYDESDNDSAVSSTRSSFNSTFSPPPSPTKSDILENGKNRVLKPFSVEAINRKNILASAKCRSGKNFKIGSPVIQRKDVESLRNISINKISLITKKSDAVPITKGKTEIIKNNTQDNLTPTSPKMKHSRERKISSMDTFSTSNVLAKSNNKSINVKALKLNFENTGANHSTTPVKYVPPLATAITKNKSIQSPKVSEVKEVKIVKLDSENSENIKIKTNPINAENILTKFIELNLASTESSLGITLAGGIDYESKDITIHRIRFGSIAYIDGRLKRGDKVISINGKNTRGLSHALAVELLKEPREKFVIEVEDALESNINKKRTSKTVPRRSMVTDAKRPIEDRLKTISKQPTNIVTLCKDGAGFGFSIEGGKNSLVGDMPLLVKKIFTGGAADKCGELKIGDEIILVNDINFTDLTRIEAWSAMKKIPDGPVKIHVFR